MVGLELQPTMGRLYRGNVVRSPAAQILETALALQRAPGERFRLRERPLPDGLVHVLEVASGSAQAVAVAAAELGESEPDLLEASRFYLEQVLFAAPDATAYRILGVPQDATPDLIRIHHRWLQRWLHPDRAQAGDASVYATRVNQAWATLRSPELRHQYDVQLAEARLAGASAPLPAATVRHWEHDELAPTHGRRSRWLLGAALVACAVLAVLVVRHEQGPEPWSPGAGNAVVESDQSPTDQPAIEDRDLGILAEALAIATTPAPVEPTHGRLPDPTPALLPDPLPVGAAQAATLSLPATPVAARAAPRREMHSPRPHLVGAAQSATKPPARVQVAARAAPASEPLEPQLVGAAQTPAKPAEPPTVLLERMHQAEQRVAQVTAYLAAEPGAAPLWNDVQTQAAAERVRNRISTKGGAFEFAPPAWNLQRDNATLSVDYQCAGCRVSRGRIDVQLVWREGLWLVRGVGLAPAA